MLKKITILMISLGLAFGLMLLTTDDSRFEIQAEIVLPLSTAQVWETLAVVEDWPQWWPGVEIARLEGPLAVGSSILLQMKGRPETSPALLVRVEERQELTWERQGVLGSWAGTGFVLQDVAGGCRVRVENFIRGPQAFLARVTGRDAFAKYQQKLLDNLQLATTSAGEKD